MRTRRDRLADRRAAGASERGAGVLVAGAVACVLSVPALAGPENPTVVNGTASFAQSGSTTTITAGDNAIINYSAFNVGASETVRFVQPDASSRVLNRITGGAPSLIDGSLFANGVVYFVNPAGVFFGANSIVDVGRLYAAAGNLSNEDFLAGIDRFTDLGGEVVNHGSVRTHEGAHFVGFKVANFGSVVADGGMITFSAGDSVYMGRRDGRVFTEVTGTVLDGSSVTNAGLVDAGTGSVRMGAGDHVALALYGDSIIRGSEVAVTGGVGSRVDVSGVISTADRGLSGTGGSISISGGDVLLAGAALDASGALGGGSITVGEGSATALVDGSSSLRADATAAGAGGVVTVVSGEGTLFDGSLSARGAGVDGVGGVAHVSGDGLVTVSGAFDLSGAAGLGSLLIDPTSIRVVSGPVGELAGTLGGPGTSAGVGAGASTVALRDALRGMLGDGIIEAADLTSWLRLADVRLVSGRDIAFDAGVVVAPSGLHGLSLTAGRSITLGSGALIDLGGSFTALVNAAMGVDGVGRFTMGAGSAISAGGDVVVRTTVQGAEAFGGSTEAFITLADIDAGGSITIDSRYLGGGGIEAASGGSYRLDASSVTLRTLSGGVGSSGSALVLGGEGAGLTTLAGDIAGDAFIRVLGEGVRIGAGAGVDGLRVGGRASIAASDIDVARALTVGGRLTLDAGAGSLGVGGGSGEGFALDAAELSRVALGGGLDLLTTGDLTLTADAGGSVLAFLRGREVSLSGSTLRFDAAGAGGVFSFGELSMYATRQIVFGGGVQGLGVSAGSLLLDVAAGSAVDAAARVLVEGSGAERDFGFSAAGELRIATGVTGGSMVNLTFDADTDHAGGEGIALGGSVTTAGGAGSGDVVFADAIDISGLLSTAGGQRFDGLVRLSGDLVLSLSGGELNMLQGVALGGSSLLIDVGAGDIAIGDIFSTGQLRDALTVRTSGGTITIGSVGLDFDGALDEQGAMDTAANFLAELNLDANFNGGMGGSIVFGGVAYHAGVLAFNATNYGTANALTPGMPGDPAAQRAILFGDEASVGMGGGNSRLTDGFTSTLSFGAGTLTLLNGASFSARAAGGVVTMPALLAAGQGVTVEGLSSVNLGAVGTGGVGGALGALTIVTDTLSMPADVFSESLTVRTYDVTRGALVGGADAARLSIVPTAGSVLGRLALEANDVTFDAAAAGTTLAFNRLEVDALNGILFTANVDGVTAQFDPLADADPANDATASLRLNAGAGSITTSGAFTFAGALALQSAVAAGGDLTLSLSGFDPTLSGVTAGGGVVTITTPGGLLLGGAAPVAGDGVAQVDAAALAGIGGESGLVFTSVNAGVTFADVGGALTAALFDGDPATSPAVTVNALNADAAGADGAVRFGADADAVYTFASLTLNAFDSIVFDDGASGVRVFDTLVLGVDAGSGASADMLVRVNDGGAGGDFTFQTLGGVRINSRLTADSDVNLVFEGGVGDPGAGATSVVAEIVTLDNDADPMNMAAAGRVTFNDNVNLGAGITAAGDVVFNQTVTLGPSGLFVPRGAPTPVSIVLSLGNANISFLGDILTAAGRDGADSLTVNAGTIALMNVGTQADALRELALNALTSITFNGSFHDAYRLNFSAPSYTTTVNGVNFGDRVDGMFNALTSRTERVFFDTAGGAVLTLNGSAAFLALSDGTGLIPGTDMLARSQGQVLLPGVGVSAALMAGGANEADAVSLIARAFDAVSLGATDLGGGAPGQRDVLVASRRVALNGAQTADLFALASIDDGRLIVLGDDAPAVLEDAGLGQLILSDAELANLAGVTMVDVGAATSTAGTRLLDTTLFAGSQFRLVGGAGGSRAVFAGGSTVTLNFDDADAMTDELGLLLVEGPADLESGVSIVSVGMSDREGVTFNQAARVGNGVAINTLGGDITLLGDLTFFDVDATPGVMDFVATISLDARGLDGAASADDGLVSLVNVLLDDGVSVSTLDVFGRTIGFNAAQYATGGSQEYGATQGGASYLVNQTATFASSQANGDIEFAFDPALLQEIRLADAVTLTVDAGRDALLARVTAATHNTATLLVTADRDATVQNVGSTGADPADDADDVRLASVTVTGTDVDSTLTLFDVLTVGDQTFTFAPGVVNLPGARSIELMGTRYSAQGVGDVAFRGGPVNVRMSGAGMTRVDTGAGGEVTFERLLTLFDNLDIDVADGSMSLISLNDVEGAGGVVAPFFLDANAGASGTIRYTGTQVAVGDQRYLAGTYDLFDPANANALMTFLASGGAGRIGFAGGTMDLNGRSVSALADLGMGDATASVLLPAVRGSGNETVRLVSSQAASFGGTGASGITELNTLSDTIALAGPTTTQRAIIDAYTIGSSVAIGGATANPADFEVSQALLNSLSLLDTLVDGDSNILLQVGNAANPTITDVTLNGFAFSNGGGFYNFALPEGAVVVSGANTLTTNNGAITIASGQINGAAAGVGALSLNAGLGALNLTQVFGAGAALSSLNLAGGNGFGLQQVATVGGQTFTSTTGAAISLNGLGLAGGDFAASGLGSAIMFNAPVNVAGVTGVSAGAGGQAMFMGGVNLANNLSVLIPAGASSAVFAGPVVGTGTQSLVVNLGGGGTASFGAVTDAANVDVDALTAVLGGDVSVSNFASYNAALSLIGDRTVTGAGEFLQGGSGQGGTPANLVVQGGFTFTGNFGLDGGLGRLVATGPVTLANASIRVLNGALFNAAVQVDGVSRVESVAPGLEASLRFLGAINGTGAASSLTLITNREFGQLDGGTPAPISLIEIAGDVGLLGTLGTLNLNFDPGAGIDGRPLVPANATIVFGDAEQFFATGVGENITVQVGTLNVGAREKILGTGSLRLEASGSMRVGDILAAGSLAVVSPSVVIVAREAANIFDVTTNSIVTDAGTDFVAGGGLAFSTVTSVLALPGAGTVEFALPGGDAIVGSTGAAFVVKTFTGDIAALSRLTGGRTVLLDVRGDGPSNTNVSEVLAGAAIRLEQPLVLPAGVVLDAATRDALRELGIAVREAEGGRVDDSCLPGSPRSDYVLNDEAILFDLGCALGPASLRGVTMSPERLDLSVVQRVLDSYRALFGERTVDGEVQSGATIIGAKLDTAYDRYTEVEPETSFTEELEFNLPGFAAWMTSSDAAAAVDARAELAAIRGFTRELYQLGLAGGEMRDVVDGLSTRVQSARLEQEAVRSLILMVLDPSVALEAPTAPAPAAAPAPGDAGEQARQAELDAAISVLLSRR